MKFRNPAYNAAIWEPISGLCPYCCLYCYNRYQALFRGLTTKHQIDINEPMLNWSIIYTGVFTDIFSNAIPDKMLHAIFQRIYASPRQTFVFSTKNPKRYVDLIDYLPANASYTTTIESDIAYPWLSSAPSPEERLCWLGILRDKSPSIHLEVNVQPILPFNLEKFSQALIAIKPNLVRIDFDQRTIKLKNLMPLKVRHLPEPSRAQAWKLAQTLMKNHILVGYNFKPRCTLMFKHFFRTFEGYKKWLIMQLACIRESDLNVSSKN